MDDHANHRAGERAARRAHRSFGSATGAREARAARGGHGRASHRGPGPGDPALKLHELLHPLRLGRAMRRRGVRQAILAVLLEEPMHGYQVIQDLEARSGGRWRPSAGSVYPTLQQLEDEGLVRGEEHEGRRVYTLTDAGRIAAQESPLHRHPWFSGPAREEAAETRDLITQLVGAAVQVRRAGSAAAQDQARMILIDARRQLYRLLAEDGGEDDDGTNGEDATEEGPAESAAE